LQRTKTSEGRLPVSEAKTMSAWTVKDSAGQFLPSFEADSPLDVGRKVVPGPYDAFRLRVSHSYRELFDRTLSQILERRGWEIVRVGAQRGA